MKILQNFSVTILFLCSIIIIFAQSQTVYEETYLSSPVILYPGQVANTDPNQFPELDWPKKPIAIKYLSSEVIDETGNAVPLYDLYIHHWLLYINFGKYNYGYCPLYNVWGIGAEMRGVLYNFPDPYAIILDGNETWNVNLHFIRTDTVPESSMQKCIECHCIGGTPSNPEGGQECCPDQTYCFGMPTNTTDPKKYYLRYTIRYTNITDNILPLTVYSFDVTAKENFDCYIDYQISEQSVANNTLNTWVNKSIIPQDMNVVFIEIHQHIGGINYTVEHYDSNNNYIGILCSVSPIYGNSTQVGNENGYVVGIPTCTFSTPYSLKKNDYIKITSNYGSRTIPEGAPYHEGVMGLLFFWAQRTGPSICETKLKTLCGDPLPSTTEECNKCATNHILELEFSDCGGIKYDWPVIKFLCRTDIGKKTPYPIN